MKATGLTTAFATLLFAAAAALAIDGASAPASAVAPAGTAGTSNQYILIGLIAAFGNIVHFFKKNALDETDSTIKKYLGDHTMALLFGLVVAVLAALAQSATLLNGGDGAWINAFLTGYAADSVFGKYTPTTSIIKQP